MFSLKQHVKGATHNLGHTLDLVNTPDKNQFFNGQVVQLNVSDHFLLNFNNPVKLHHTHTKLISFRPLRNIDSVQFANDIISNVQNMPASTDFGALVNWYNTTLTGIVNSHAPII